MRMSINWLRLSAMVGLINMAFPAFAKVNITTKGTSTNYDVVIEDVKFQNVNIGGKDFSKAELVGVGRFAGIEYQEGLPEIPVVRFLVVGNPTVQLLDEGEKSLKTGQLNKFLKPNQPSWSKSLKVAPPITFDKEAYASNAFFEPEIISIEDAGSYRGTPQKLITLRPFSYQPTTGKYAIRRHFNISVEGAKDDSSQANSPTIAFVIGAKFAKSPKILELEQAKISEGLRVEKLVIGQNLANTDVAIRKALQDLLNDQSKNLRFALLIGDAEDVASHAASNLTTGVTDHFYRAIDTNKYDTDINGPDIGVGRLSVNTEAQLNVVIDKIFRYRSGEFGRVDWLNHPFFVTTHDKWTVAEGTHNDVISKYFAPLKYDRVFPDATELGGDKLYPITYKATAQQIVSHMKAGRTIINFSGHGSHTGWEDVTTADVNSFNDAESMPYVMGNACITGDFRKEPVFGETWQRQPHGAITYWVQWTAPIGMRMIF